MQRLQEITLVVTDEEFELLDKFRRGRARSFVVPADGDPDDAEDAADVVAMSGGGGYLFAECEDSDSAALIAAAFNGLFRGAGNEDSE